MNKPWDVVVVSSDSETRDSVVKTLSRLGVSPICVSSVDQCRQIPQRNDIGLVFCDHSIRGSDYREVVQAVSRDSTTSQPKIVMMSKQVAADEYQQAKHSGVFEVIQSPCRPSEVEWMFILAKRNRLQERSRLVAASRYNPFGR